MRPRFYSVSGIFACDEKSSHRHYRFSVCLPPVLGIATQNIQQWSSCEWSISSQAVEQDSSVLQRHYGSKVYLPMFHRAPGPLCTPSSVRRPLIMIATGTGVAPFVSLLQHRAVQMQQQEQQSSALETGEVLVFVGCRHEKYDLCLAHELQKLHRDGIISLLSIASSRTQKGERASPVKYVQNQLLRNGARVYAMLQHYAREIDTTSSRKNESLNSSMAWLYLCGRRNAMAQCVVDTLVQIAEAQGDMEECEARSLIRRLYKNNAFHAEVWDS